MESARASVLEYRVAPESGTELVRPRNSAANIVAWLREKLWDRDLFKY
jgi:hypothetical protein